MLQPKPLLVALAARRSGQHSARSSRAKHGSSSLRKQHLSGDTRRKVPARQGSESARRQQPALQKPASGQAELNVTHAELSLAPKNQAKWCYERGVWEAA